VIKEDSHRRRLKWRLVVTQFCRGRFGQVHRRHNAAHNDSGLLNYADHTASIEIELPPTPSIGKLIASPCMTCAMTLPRGQGVPLAMSKIRSENLAPHLFAAHVLRKEPDEEDEEEEEDDGEEGEDDGEEGEDDNEDDDEGYSP